jgi:hypothetical protein
MDLILIIIILLLLFGGGFGYSRYGYRGGIGIGGILLIILIVYLLLGPPIVRGAQAAGNRTATFPGCPEDRRGVSAARQRRSAAVIMTGFILPLPVMS